MDTRGRQRTSHPARSVCLLILVWWHSGSGGQGGPEGSGLPGDVCQHLGDVQTLNLAVNQLISQLKVIRRVQSSASLFLSHCLLLASTVGFIYHFYLSIWWCSRWPNLRVHSPRFLREAAAEGPTGRRSSAITSSLAAAEIDPPRKASWC